MLAVSAMWLAGFTNTRKRFWAPWVKRQQQAGLVSAGGVRGHDAHLKMTTDSMAHVTFDGFSLQGS